MQVVGYSDQISLQPGQPVNIMVSCKQDNYQADFVRLMNGDNHPDGPGVKEEEIPSNITGKHPGRVQEFQHGSYIKIDNSPGLYIKSSFTIQAWIY
ncbi:MAG: LamG domain-containing protein, partial [Dehalococcoidia bacterium]